MHDRAGATIGCRIERLPAVVWQRHPPARHGCQLLSTTIALGVKDLLPRAAGTPFLYHHHWQSMLTRLSINCCRSSLATQT